jgi:hypothetical protein
MTKKELYRFVAKTYGRSGYWIDARDRGVISPTEEDLNWIRELIENDPAVGKIQDVDQYQCYDCEEQYPGKPFYTMIPSTPAEPGAFLCHFCFRGLEAKGFTPDDPSDTRQIL